MTVAKYQANSFSSLGNKGSRQDNEMLAIDGLMFTSPEFGGTPVQIATESFWTDGIRAGSVFPLNGLDSYEVQDSEDKIYEAPSGNRKMLKRGKSRYMFNLDIPINVHKALQSFNNGNLTAWLIRDGKICGYEKTAGVLIQGFSTNMINAGRMGEVPADGSTPAYSPLYVDLANHREWNVYGVMIEPEGWEPNNLVGIIDVTIAQAASPKSTTAVSFSVYSTDGYDGAGAAKKVYIKGLLAADLVFTTAAGAAQAAWSLTEPANNGIYVITATVAETLVAGLISITGSVTDGILVKTTGDPVEIAVA